jgi:hypothetical protein
MDVACFELSRPKSVVPLLRHFLAVVQFLDGYGRMDEQHILVPLVADQHRRHGRCDSVVSRMMRGIDNVLKQL